MKLVISSGHGKLVRGASGYIDEVDEARKVVETVADILRDVDVEVLTFHDDVSTSQNENLNRIVNYHNSQNRELDVSVHFNAYQTTSGPMGTECLYVTQQTLAGVVASKMSEGGEFTNRGPKKRTDLFFLNKTEMPSVLLEVCFVDSKADVDAYHDNYDELCIAIAEGLTGISIGAPEEPDKPPVQPPQQPPVESESTVEITIKPIGNVRVLVNGEEITFGKTQQNPAPY